MIQEVKTVEDVRTFFNELQAERLNFQPDDDFADYINYETNNRPTLRRRRQSAIGC